MFWRALWHMSTCIRYLIICTRCSQGGEWIVHQASIFTASESHGMMIFFVLVYQSGLWASENCSLLLQEYEWMLQSAGVSEAAGKRGRHYRKTWPHSATFLVLSQQSNCWSLALTVHRIPKTLLASTFCSVNASLQQRAAWISRLGGDGYWRFSLDCSNAGRLGFLWVHKIS